MRLLEISLACQEGYLERQLAGCIRSSGPDIFIPLYLKSLISRRIAKNFTINFLHKMRNHFKIFGNVTERLLTTAKIVLPIPMKLCHGLLLFLSWNITLNDCKLGNVAKSCYPQPTTTTKLIHTLMSLLRELVLGFFGE
jgi:hypothetical protein